MKDARMDSAGTRPYRQRARAQAASRTRNAVLDAVVALGMEKAAADMSLADVAERAGVSVQTVLRHFGTRDGLLDASIAHGAARIAAERRPVSADLPTAITTLFDHYEARGDAVMRLLAQEAFDERIAQITAEGRRVHREWVGRFVAVAAGLEETSDALIDQLVIVTDVYAWKILRRDRGLSRNVAEHRMLGMVEALLRPFWGGEEEPS